MIVASTFEPGGDMELAAAFRRGDQAAFGDLFTRYKDGVYSLVVRTVGVIAAEDVTQDVFVRVLRSLKRFRGDSSLRTWIYRITINACADHIRTKSRRPQTSQAAEAEQVSDATQPAADMTTGWMRSEIEQAVATLPEMERAAVELHYVQGLSYAEMAEVLSCPSGTVKARVHDAVTKLRRKLSYLVEEAEQ